MRSVNVGSNFNNMLCDIEIDGRGRVKLTSGNRFFPDFIMWIRNNHNQKIIFIDPKGISRFSLDNPKLTLHNYLKTTVQPRIAGCNSTLDAYIISVTPFDSLYKTLPKKKNIDRLASANHLLFMKET
ncbi:MAG: hypothetical protein V1850_01605, partial [Candidatus Bathyarchaeota archaeon]